MLFCGQTATNCDKMRHEAVSPRNSAMRKTRARASNGQEQVESQEKLEKTWENDEFSRIFPATKNDNET
jgi:hypothetical protein